MHTQALEFFRHHLADLEPLAVVEFGSCNMNGSVRDVYPQASSWLGIDRQSGRGVDVVADAATFTTDQRFGLCVCAEVFEHTDQWRDLIDNAHRLLEPGGLLLASCATDRRPPHSAVDGGPLRDGEFYRNVPLTEMLDALTGWSYSEAHKADGHFGGDDLYVKAIK